MTMTIRTFFYNFLPWCLALNSMAVNSAELDSLGFQSFNNEVAVKIEKLSEPAPTVILVHGGAGVRASNNMNVWAYIVKGWGYNVVTVDLFSKRGFYELAQQGWKLSFRTRANDVIEVAKYISAQPWHKGGIGVIGFSQGGSTVFTIGHDRSQIVISAGVAFYPGCSYESPPFTPSMPTQIHFAMKDDLANPYLCGGNFSLKKYNVQRYKNASHTFDIAAEKRVTPQGNRIWHDPEAFSQSQLHTMNFLKEHVGR